MRRRLSTLLNKYEPRLLSRSTTILKPSSNTCCSIVSRTFAGGIGFAPSVFGVRFRVEGVSARTGAILIRDRNLLRECGQRRLRNGWQAGSLVAESGKPPDRLHNALAQQLVLPSQQFLHQIVAAFVHVARCPGEMMIDPRSG